jgi:RimJ/RimL family protein N-acetyltransferase
VDDRYHRPVAGTAEHGHALTERLDLRAMARSDVDPLYRIMADPRTRAYIPGGAHDSAETTRLWVDRFSARWELNGIGYWTARLRETGDVIGVGGVDRREEFWNLYYLIDPTRWGRGYATELARVGQLTATAIDPDLPLAAWIHADNAASQGVAHRVGLRDYGRLEPDHWKGEPMHYWADRDPRRTRDQRPG